MQRCRLSAEGQLSLQSALASIFVLIASALNQIRIVHAYHDYTLTRLNPTMLGMRKPKSRLEVAKGMGTHVVLMQSSPC
eukprot:4277386-Amphidinium_carterae.1